MVDLDLTAQGAVCQLGGERDVARVEPSGFFKSGIERAVGERAAFFDANENEVGYSAGIQHAGGCITERVVVERLNSPLETSRCANEPSKRTIAGMRHFLVCFPLAVVLGLSSACSDDASDLTARLSDGQVRAGVITKEAELIGGSTAEGEIGDFKLYNSKIAVIVEKPGPSDGYGTYGGMIVDADVIRPVGEPGQSMFGEALTIYNMRTPRGVSAEVVNDGADGKAAIVRMVAEDAQFVLIESMLGEPEAPKGLKITMDYVLEPDSNVLTTRTTIKNTIDERIYVGHHYLGFLMGNGLLPFLVGDGFAVSEVPTNKGQYYAAVGENVSYSFLSLENPFTPFLSLDGFQLGSLPSFVLDPGDEYPLEMSLIVGDGDLATHEAAHRALMVAGDWPVPEVATVTGTVKDAAGKPMAGAYVHVRSGDKKIYRLRTRTDSAGAFKAELEPGEYVFTATAGNRDPGEDVRVTLPSASEIALSVPAAGWLVIDATEGANGEPLPVKLMIKRTSDFTPAPASFGGAKGARGYERVEFLKPGRQKLELPPGEWKVVVARGTEYEAVQKTVTVSAGEDTVVEAPMLRTVDSAGWICGDFHIHTQYSPDSDDPAELKVRAFGAEGVEVPVVTDHGHVSDFSPVVKRLGYEKWVRTIVGEEVSTTHLGHLNRFPLVQDLTMSNKGAIEWFGLSGGEIMEAMRKNPGNPIVQINHPRSGTYGNPFVKGYFSGVGLDSATMTALSPHEWSLNFDTIEIANRGRPDYEDWFAFLDRGLLKWATGGSDSHTAINDMVGYPRNCVRAGTDEPSKLDQDAFMAAIRAGKMVVSGGYLVELGAGEYRVGDLVPGKQADAGELEIQARVQAPTWVGGATLEIVVNGEVVESRPVPETMQLDAERIRANIKVPVPTNADAWIIARVVQGPDMAPVHPGASAWGFTNPVLFDGDGDGKFTGRLPMP